jgi:hypothetical protein
VAAKKEPTGVRWWKGNLHTHTLWSDGNDYPEMVTDWYKRRGYHFLALSDHNVMLEGEKWISVTNNKGGPTAFQSYVSRFGKKWARTREVDGVKQVRLRTLAEFQPLFEKHNRFLLIPSEEITDQFEKRPIHMNATNLRDFIPPQGGSSVYEVMQNNIDAVLAQRTLTGQPMFPHLNHPNFGWGVAAEDLMRVRGEKFFEVYNGHPQVHNDGDARHPGTERIWDIALTFRIAELGLEPFFGLAVDDSHHYHFNHTTNSNPGRGWVMVRAPQLTKHHLIAALEAGDFYASTGVELKDLQVTNNQISISIQEQAGITYTTLFLGTRKDFDRRMVPGKTPPGNAWPINNIYSDEIGTVLASVDGKEASYKFKGDELYVRAKVISSKTKYNPGQTGELELAWTQPVIPTEPPAPPAGAE